MDIIAFTVNALEDLKIPVTEGWYNQDIDKTQVTLMEYLEQELLYEDDEPVAIEHNLQIDVWSKDSLEAFNLKNKIRTLLKAKGFKFDDGQDFFEIEPKIYHKALRFTYLEEIGDF